MKGLDRYLTTPPEDTFDDWAEEVENLIPLPKWESYEKYVIGDWRRIENMYKENFTPEQAHNKIMTDL